jgi:hypothetical protein
MSDVVATELTSLHTSSTHFNLTLGSPRQDDGAYRAPWTNERSSGGSSSVLVASTTNSFHVNVSFEFTALATHARAQSAAAIELSVFVPPSYKTEDSMEAAGGGAGLVAATLHPPWSAAGQKMLNHTSLIGDVLVRQTTPSGHSAALSEMWRRIERRRQTSVIPAAKLVG